MSKKLANHLSPSIVPQSEPLTPAQIQNSAGGFVYAITPWQQLERFLILGSQGGSYYTSEKTLTLDNAKVIVDLLAVDGKKVVDTIVSISDEGRAIKNAPAVFALALVAAKGSPEVKKYALMKLPAVARTATDFFAFVEQYKTLGGGFGIMVRKALQAWYQSKNLSQAAYQIVKYRQRDGWTHSDILRLAHVKPKNDAESNLYKFVKNLATKETAYNFDVLPDIAKGFVLAQKNPSIKELVSLIEQYNLPREALPTEALNSAEVWEALLPKMPATALIRNLGKLSNVGILNKSFSEGEKIVLNKLSNSDWLKESRVHPITILAAMKTYSQGHGRLGSMNWEVNQKVVNALDAAFYQSFKNVEPTNKNMILALDISGSMTWSSVSGIEGLTHREASAAMALVTANVEPNYEILGFSTTLKKLAISPSMRLNDVCKYIETVPMGGTDCSQPMLWATANKVKADAFVVYTDNEPWAGHVHPSVALKDFRRKMNKPNAKLIVCATSATGGSIADPSDAGMLDIVGFDTSVPQVISEFVKG
jgi:60 kDa SS-A/Ro ribonucleoprotein